ncbi:MAG: hypothetical protein Q4D57_00150 [Clostridia bacterium]|nr:hypothetical protein [Clostridia bacterium]
MAMNSSTIHTDKANIVKDLNDLKSNYNKSEQKDHLHLIQPYQNSNATKNAFPDYITDLFKRGNKTGPYYGVLVKKFPGKVSVDDDEMKILIPDFANIPDTTLKKYETAINSLESTLSQKNTTLGISSTGGERDYITSGSVEYKDINKEIIQPAKNRIER